MTADTAVKLEALGVFHVEPDCNRTLPVLVGQEILRMVAAEP